MIHEFRLPDLGEGLTESEVVAWRVAVGDRVELNQMIADIETAKAVVELPSPVAGTIAALHAEPGQTVNVGEPLLSFDVTDDPAAAATPADTPEPEAAGADAAPEPNLVGYGARAEPTRPHRRARVARPGPATAPQAPVAAVPAEQPRSTPPVRKLARDLGIDLTTVDGTGTHGMITRADVEAAATASTSQSPDTTAQPVPAEQRVPIRGVRKATAAAMVASAFTAPHVTEFLTVDVTATIEFLERSNGSHRPGGRRANVLAVCSKAVCIALARRPSLNSRWDESAQEIVQFSGVNLGIAVATDRGLVVPNIKDAGSLGLFDLAQAISDLANTARAGTTQPVQMRGGTFTITNIGVFGIDAGTPILNPGEAGILALGAVRRQPWEYHGDIALRDLLTLSLSFDHRLVDGEQGSRFLADVGAILRDPAHVLALV